MTSNLGSAEIFAPSAAEEDRVSVRDRVMDHVREHFRPEFINRIDEFITFQPLTRDQIVRIVQLRAQRLVARLSEKRMALELRPSAVEFLASVGYDPVYGARPVKRALQRELQTLLAQALLRNEFEEQDTIVVEAAAAAGGGDGGGALVAAAASAAPGAPPVGLVLRKGPKIPLPAPPATPRSAAANGGIEADLQAERAREYGDDRSGNGNGAVAPGSGSSSDFIVIAGPEPKVLRGVEDDVSATLSAALDADGPRGPTSEVPQTPDRT
eukprot:349960-Chlamydomonas_euryale.AAC.1